MQNFVFENPTKIIFGKGSIAKIGAEVKRFRGRAVLDGVKLEVYAGETMVVMG